MLEEEIARATFCDIERTLDLIIESLDKFEFRNPADHDRALKIAAENLVCIRDHSESPIELVLFCGLVYVSARIRPFGLMVHSNTRGRYRNAVTLTLQEPFEDLGIRVDAVAWLNNPLVIECDGYEFHSGKEEFGRDRKRDRMLGEEGFRVLRYSGQEIYNEPVKSSLDLLDAIFPPTVYPMAI